MPYAHIECDAIGEPLIAGTRIKVHMIALDQITHGRDAEEIHRHHPDLTMGQIHSALAYDYDHRDEIDRDIARRYQQVLARRDARQESPGRRKLRQQGLLP